MENDKPSSKRLSDDETAAIVATSTVVVFFAIYWFLQIQSVRELLELAYG